MERLSHVRRQNRLGSGEIRNCPGRIEYPKVTARQSDRCPTVQQFTSKACRDEVLIVQLPRPELHCLGQIGRLL